MIMGEWDMGETNSYGGLGEGGWFYVE